MTAEKQELERQKQIKQRKKTIMVQVRNAMKMVDAKTTRISEYETMKSKVKLAMDKLKEARNNIIKANNELKNAYTSTMANQKSEKIRESQQLIETMLVELNTGVLPAIKSKIDQLNIEIRKHNRYIRDLQHEFNSLG